MSEHRRKLAPGDARSRKGSSQRGHPCSPRAGDIVVSEPSARADVYEIRVLPATARMVVRRYRDAIETVCELAGQLRVDGWYTGDQTHYVQIAGHRRVYKE
jgi:hypothetical protein